MDRPSLYDPKPFRPKPFSVVASLSLACLIVCVVRLILQMSGIQDGYYVETASGAARIISSHVPVPKLLEIMLAASVLSIIWLYRRHRVDQS